MADEQRPTPMEKARSFGARIARGMSFTERIDILVRVLLMAVVAYGCYLVVAPFLTAIIIAAVLAVATWPIFDKLLAATRRRSTPAAVIMVLGIVVVVLIPMSFILIAAAQQLPKGIAAVIGWVKDPAPILEGIAAIPYAGPWLHDQVLHAIDPATFSQTVQKLLEPMTSLVVNSAVSASNGLFQLALVTFIAFFFYRDGPWFADRIRALIERVSGGIASEISGILINTTRSVVNGIVGTAIAQGLVAGIGFWIADVPGVLLWSAAVCLLSVVPIGPPLVWIPAAVWLYAQGDIGMAVFMIIWGTAAVSSVDNVVKPLLISRGSTLPLALIFLGVFGGVIAFGFLGLILGPVLLAIGISLFQAWLRKPVSALAQTAQRAHEQEAHGASEDSKSTF